MNTAMKIFAFLLAITLSVAACQNHADDTDPGIFDLKVDNAISLSGEGEHQLGTVATFSMNLSDNRGLDEFQVDVNGSLDYTENLEGTTAGVSYPFTVDADSYDVGDRIEIVFIVEDGFGNTFARPYYMTIVE